MHPVAAGACAGLGLASGGLVPVLVARLAPVAVAAPTPQEPDRTELVDVAAVAQRPWLVAWTVPVCGVAAALLGASLGATWSLLYLLALVPVGVALAVIDWHTRILPSRLIYPAYLLVLLTLPLAWLLDGRPGGAHPLLGAAVGAAVVFGCFHLVWFVARSQMGYGDVRLSGLLGLVLGYLGWRELIVGVYAGFLLGGVLGSLLAWARVVDRRGYPFGPFLLAGALVGIVAGRPVMDLFAS